MEAMILKFRDVLLQTERMAPAALGAYQNDLAHKLIQHAARHVPAYRDRGLKAAGSVDPGSADWLSIPLVTRKMLHDQPARFWADQVPPFAGAVEDGKTSGSTGRPLTYRHEELHDIASAAQTDRFFGWRRLDGRKSLGTFMSTYDDLANRGGKTRGGWRIGVPDSVRHICELMIDVDGQLDWMERTRPTYLFARGGAHIQALAERAERRGSKLRFDCMLSTGTAVGPDARKAARRVFRSDVADLYGASETGLIAAECKSCGLYHTCDETVRVEVLGEDGRPVADGEIGRVVVTPLYAYAMPMLRYEIGDYAVRGPAKAPCGRGLGSLKSIVGRYRNVFRLRDGRLIAPYANATGMGALLRYDQLQIVQVALDRLELRYVSATDAPVDQAAIDAFVKRAFDPSLSASAVRVERFEAAAHGKFEETLCLLPAA